MRTKLKQNIESAHEFWKMLAGLLLKSLHVLHLTTHEKNTDSVQQTLCLLQGRTTRTLHLQDFALNMHMLKYEDNFCATSLLFKQARVL